MQLPDLGFPNSWGLKDVIVLLGAAGAVVSTWAAVQLGVNADRIARAVDVHEYRLPGEDDTKRQARLAGERSRARAVAEEAKDLRWLSGACWILAVLMASISSMPWLTALIFVLAAGGVAYYIMRNRSSRAAIRRRLVILDLIWETRSYSVITPFMNDDEINSFIDQTFAEPDKNLPKLEAAARTGLQTAKDTHAQYLADRNKPKK